jgi:hypothetical protein
MGDRPIMFSAPMVCALLAGRKTQTRRKLKLKGTGDLQFAIGDRLYVKETWTHDAESLEALRAAVDDAYCDMSHGPFYRATEPAADTMRWKAALFMPRWVSRITLVVKEVRTERLQDISEADAIAEGLKPETCAGQRMWDPGPPHGHFAHPQVAYRMIWEDINGPGSWDKNPWVAALTFAVHTRNIDQIGRAA